MPSTADEKFLQAQLKLKAACEKYAQDYESSSEEEEIESEDVIDKILKNYADIAGKQSDLERTQNFLENAFLSGAATCLICIASVKRTDSIWSCEKCYCFFHLACIQRWSKDSIALQRMTLEERPAGSKPLQVCWGCPKCRQEYRPDEIPQTYLCFCKKTKDPEHQRFLVPHSCGEVCRKNLVPECGHSCVLLCHPGPCPPCPKMVKSDCFCGSKPARMQRCSSKEWSCGSKCGKKLACGKHPCPRTCHVGLCLPCPHQSVQKCCCGRKAMKRECSSPVWQCGEVCGKAFSCGHHSCDLICHAGDCGDCAFSKPRRCPCGKSLYELHCTEDTPTCGDTCGKLLECGVHTCGQKCHKDNCGSCLEIVVKSCRCGLHRKEVHCNKQYLCETKCKRIRDCLKHPCNKKCCTGNCAPCEKPCGRTLSCGSHKCTSICHRGPCYPCNLKDVIKCRCGHTAISVPCGKKKRTKPPPCSKPCLRPPDCHHDSRVPHRCHFGLCPLCWQRCDLPLACGHKCPKTCHTGVEAKKAKQGSAECPPCVVPLPVTCPGAHETIRKPCWQAVSKACGRRCGRHLACGNHTCSMECHTVVDAADELVAGSNCKPCQEDCHKSRPEGCSHPCTLPCHPGECDPCKQIQRYKCHCGINWVYIHCADYVLLDKRDKAQSCGNQCPKLYECGHRCRSNCHAGACPGSEACKKKLRISCPCKRLKKDVACELVKRSGGPSTVLQCDDVCRKKLKEELKEKEKEAAAKRRQEEEKNRRELEEFERKFQPRRRHRDRRDSRSVQEDLSLFARHKRLLMVVLPVSLAVAAVAAIFLLN